MYANYGDIMQDQIDKVTADIQSRVAQFLQLKSTLVSLRQSSNPMIATKANALFTRQTQLEDLLSVNLTKIKALQASGLTLSSMPDLISIGNFASSMESQISDVNTLSDQARGIAPTAASRVASIFTPKNVLIGAGALVIGSVVYKKFVR